MKRWLRSNHQPRLELSRALLLAAGAWVFSSCAWFADPVRTSPPTVAAGADSAARQGENGQPLYVVSADYTPFYRMGPQQANGADQSLSKGTLVTLLKKTFGYSRVQLVNGPNGYVATDDLAPAPPEAVPAPAAPLAGPEGGNSAIVEHYSVDQSRSSANTSAGNAEALPDLPEGSLEPQPTPVIAPEFRY